MVYALRGASAFRLSASGSIYQDLRTAAKFYQQLWAERMRQVKLCQQDTTGGTLSTGSFRADHARDAADMTRFVR